MKKACRFVSLILGLLMIVSVVSCNGDTKKETAPISEIKLDDGYAAITVEGGKYEYDVEVPLGNPRIPVVSLDIEGAVIKQDYCFTGAGSANAEISFEKDGKAYNYKINFIPSGTDIVFQYGDHYKFTPNYELKEGESFTFKSSDVYTVFIESDGYYLMRKLSETPITLTASVNGTVVDTLVISRIVRAQALYVIMAGGPNATIDFGSTKDANAPREGTVYTTDLSTGSVRKNSGCGGILPSLAKKWNSLTREKTIACVSALSTSKLEDWLSGGERLTTTIESFNKTLDECSKDDTNLEIRHYGLVYMGGENDHDADAVAYADMLVGVIDTVEAVHKLDFCAIIPCRASRTYAKNPVSTLKMLDGPRAAAYSLHNYRENVFIGSLVTENANISNGMAEQENVRLTQAAYNTIGEDIVNNAYNRMNGVGNTVESVVLLDSNGATAASGITAQPDGKSVAAYTLPLTATEKLNITAEGSGISVSKTGIAYVTDTTKGGSVTYKANDKTVSVTLGEYTKTVEQTVDPLANLSLREKVIYTMNEMATFKWISVYDVKHAGADYISKAFTDQKGIPYGSHRGSLADFKKQLVDGLYMGPATTTVDNNCTSAVAFALMAADPQIAYMLSDKVDQISGYLTPLLTGYGVSKLGDYVVTIPANVTEFTAVTKPIIDENGQQKMYDCYALLEKGDYVVMRKGTGNSHVRIVVSNVVKRDASGRVTGGNLIVMEQGAGLSHRGDAYSSYSTNSQVSYDKLFEGYYVPMTLDAYHK